MKRQLLCAAFLLAGTMLTGCAGYGGYYVRQGPPPPRYGVTGYAPGPGYVWTDGYWQWRNRDWQWAPGRWVRPPRPHAVWESPRWDRDGRGYRFHRGHWR
jgi:hypothetical protein